MDLTDERDTNVSERVRGRLTGMRGLELRERMESLRSAQGSVVEDSEDEDAAEYDADDARDDDDDVDEDDDGGGAGPVMAGVTGADCVQGVLSTACVPTSNNFLGLDALWRDVRDTVEPVFLPGVSHDAYVAGDTLGSFDDCRVVATGVADGVALGNKE